MNDSKAKFRKPRSKYKYLGKRNWKLFVAQRLSIKWQEKSQHGTKIRQHHKYPHRLSRKGYAGLAREIVCIELTEYHL